MYLALSCSFEDVSDASPGRTTVDGLIMRNNGRIITAQYHPSQAVHQTLQLKLLSHNARLVSQTSLLIVMSLFRPTFYPFFVQISAGTLRVVVFAQSHMFELT